MPIRIANPTPNPNIEKDDVTIVSNSQIINFEGNLVSVTDEGQGKATVTIDTNAVDPFDGLCQVLFTCDLGLILTCDLQVVRF